MRNAIVIAIAPAYAFGLVISDEMIATRQEHFTFRLLAV
jgi:hypothetical protein